MGIKTKGEKMKKIVGIMVIGMNVMAGTYWTPENEQLNGFNVEHTCKQGVQIVRFTKGIQVFEQPYCYNRSTWDHDCVHPPIACYKDGNNSR